MSTRSASAVAFVRAILLALAVAAAAYAFVFVRQDPAAAAQRTYACPMHAEATAAGPGTCPICGMALAEVHKAIAAPETARAESGLRQQGTIEIVRRRIFSQEQRASAWVATDHTVRALLYQDEVASLEPGERAAFSAGAAAPVSVRLGARPPVRWDARTSTVDFEVEGKSAPLHPGATGSLELPARPRSALVVSSSAVLESSDGPYLLASPDGRTFIRRHIAVGKTVNGLTSVIAGLREQERVMIRGAFFVDSQARFQAETESIAATGQ